MASSRSQRVHVAGFSWPFDRPRGWARSGEPRSFFKKTLLLFGNQPTIQSPSQDILQETPQIFLKSTRSPERMPSGFFAKKPYLFRKSTRAPQTLSPFFAKTSSDFSQINIQSNFNYIFFFQKKMFGQCTARMGAPERLVGFDRQKYRALRFALRRPACLWQVYVKMNDCNVILLWSRLRVK